MTAKRNFFIQYYCQMKNYDEKYELQRNLQTLKHKNALGSHGVVNDVLRSHNTQKLNRNEKQYKMLFSKNGNQN